MSIQIENAVTFDVEMTDYDEARDITAIRVSTTVANIEIARGYVSISQDGDYSIEWYDKHDASGFKPLDEARLTTDVVAAIKSEFNQFPDVENLRDLFNEVVPSGVTTPAGAGYQI